MIRLGLIGFPVAHSKSPKLQTAALRHNHLEGEYNLYPVDPAQPEALVVLLNRIRSGELTGLNVTIPYKQNVIPLLDELTPSAQAIGAVNLIYRQAGKLIGHNTDAPGFLADLNQFLEKVQIQNRKSAIVLGAGGSARAVVYALTNDGWQITLAARRMEQAQTLIDSIQLKVSANVLKSAPVEAQALLPLLDGIDLVTNTTPVGMSPKTDFSPWPLALPFPKKAAFYDLVYNPRETLLVKQARAAGLPATTGLGMLVEQAVLGFEIWTGHSVPREVLFNAVEE
jgi:shikimate dehydrogenase